MIPDAHTWLCDQYRRLLAVAQAATPGPWDYNPGKMWILPGRQSSLDGGEEFVGAGSADARLCIAATGPADDRQSMADAEHIATFNPTLVSAICKAALELLERHKPVSPDVWASGTPRPTWCFSCTSAEYLAWPCPDALSLAAPFVDLPDFPEELRHA